MTDEIPTPEPSPLTQACRALVVGCLVLHGLIRAETTTPAERAQLRAAHATIAAAVLSLHDPARVGELRRQAIATRGVVGREWTAEEVADVYQMILLVLEDDAKPSTAAEGGRQ